MKDECPNCEGNCDCYDVGISLTEDKYTEMLISAQSQIKELERKLKIAEEKLTDIGFHKKVDGLETRLPRLFKSGEIAREALKQIRGE